MDIVVAGVVSFLGGVVFGQLFAKLIAKEEQTFTERLTALVENGVMKAESLLVRAEAVVAKLGESAPTTETKK